MKDFFIDVMTALRDGSIDRLLAKNRGDPTIDLSISKEPVVVAASAFYSQLMGDNSIEGIYDHGLATGVEIPFTGIFDEGKKIFYEFVKGPVVGCLNIVREATRWEFPSGQVIPEAFTAHPFLRAWVGAVAPTGVLGFLAFGHVPIIVFRILQLCVNNFKSYQSNL